MRINELTYGNHLELYLCTVSAQESPVPCLSVCHLHSGWHSTHFPTLESFPHKHTFLWHSFHLHRTGKILWKASVKIS